MYHKLTEDAQSVLESINPPIDDLLNEVLENYPLERKSVRLTRVTPADHPTKPRHVTLPDQVLFNEHTVLYEPTAEDLSRLGATSARLEWYDTTTESWVRDR